jgi:hypothetical protein
MAEDNFAAAANTANPATRSTPVAPHDANEIEVCRALLVGTAGTVIGRLRDDSADRTFKLGAGEHPLRFKLIKATGTTAADMLALY